MSHRFGSKESVVENRRNFLNQIRIPSERSVFIEVQHGTKIIEGTTSLAGIGFGSSASAIKADAIFTKERNLALVVLTADCIPAIIYDRTNQILGLIHLSRHNTENSFSQIVISFMRREYNTNLSELKVFFGPSIKKGSYILSEYPDGYDLVSKNVHHLLLKGLSEENIFIDPTDTASSSDFYSHYRAARNKDEEGRFATVAMLV